MEYCCQRVVFCSCCYPQDVNGASPKVFVLAGRSSLFHGNELHKPYW